MAPLNILHVDDEADIREVTALSLELDPEMAVQSAVSGQDALDILTGGYRPDVILLDVMMPDLDGPGTLERLRRLPGCEATPVIFMTARTRKEERDAYIALGAVSVITKPFDPMTLGAHVRDVLAESRA
ncbi:MAG: response regulator [Brevundimonas sp.]|uniref:response regulator n=1 Tax=Brevundimonas sp. TaxID=1871086 RepID=UPI00120AD6D3|nr:response regulator [Brevundimonas sp.]RZJ19676.1 MAG: response regulator [Brevundimonas sp.]